MRKIGLEQIAFVGSGIKRPECVLCTASGAILVADWRGGVTVIDGADRQSLVRATTPRPAGGVKPNGIALMRDGTFLITHLDDEEGGVWRLARDGTLSPWLVEIDGTALPPTNFVYLDAKDRVWITVSTRHIPRTMARTTAIADGFIILADKSGSRVVADGIGYTNEAKIDPTGEWLYVNETFGRRISRYPINRRGELGARQTVVEFEHGVFPDGLDFDEQGGIWIVSIFSNRVLRIDRDGKVDVLLEDFDAEYLDQLERDFVSGALIDRQPEKVPSKILGNISSIAFGGADRRTAYLGCLQDTRIATFRSPVAGVRPPHWNFT